MTTFEDGPAKGQTLSLGRAPIFLRVVRDDKDLTFDALDQTEDSIRAGETAIVYARKGKAGMMHVYRRGNTGGGSGWYAVATYALHPTQPPQETLRDTVKWRAWTVEEAARIGLTKPPAPSGNPPSEPTNQ